MKRGARQTVFRKLEALYRDMAGAYEDVAGAVGLSCAGCPDNCCTSFFQHHTYVEWLFLRRGLAALGPDELAGVRERAGEYVRTARAMAGRSGGAGPMCPLNADGLCVLYSHRLMICRLFGVPNSFTRPDGRTMRFEGCFACRDLADGQSPVLDRTPLYRRLAALEMELLGKRLRTLPRVDLTIAEMIVQAPPQEAGADPLAGSGS